MKILVTGANGFIGSQVVNSLLQRGHIVTACVRRLRTAKAHPKLHFVQQELSTEADWSPLLRGIDVVINCAGILKQTDTQTFYQVHEQGPKALYDACMQAGVQKIVQVSALGNPDDAEFIRSKYAGDDYLQQLELDWVIVRPSVVYTLSGSYGGTSLLRALAAIPWVLCLPGSGEQRIQPIEAGDLVGLLLHLAESNQWRHRVLEAGGAEVVTIKEYLLQLRAWLGIESPKWIWSMPALLLTPGMWLADKFSRGPMGMSMQRMLESNNVVRTEDNQLLQQLPQPPRGLSQVLQQAVSFVQDRWHARLYLLTPLLRFVVALVWIITGLVSLFMPASEVEHWAHLASIDGRAMQLMVWVGAAFDLFLGMLLLMRWRVGLISLIMLVTVIAYTLGGTWLWPHLWLDPFGPLLKNLPLLVVLPVMAVLSNPR